MSGEPRSAVAVNKAQGTANYLDHLGERKRANDVRRVCRSNIAYRASLTQAMRENRQLRETLAAMVRARG